MKNAILCSLLAIFFFSCKKSEALVNTNPPVITSINPSSGHPDTLVTITGNNFSNTANENIVKFNGVAATVVSANATSIVAKVPIGAGDGIITVASKYGTGNGPAFIYLPDIFILDNAVDTKNVNIFIRYWKNGVPYLVSDSNLSARSYSMAVKGPDVYIPYSTNLAGIGVVNLWKNGTVSDLTDGKNNADCNSILISGNDIYVTGTESNGTKQIAKYWKNNQAIILGDGTNDSYATGIAINGTDIYISGEEDLPNGNRIPKYWKNGVATTLPSAYNNGGAGSISIVNNDVYILGIEFSFTSNQNVGEYWKNGVLNGINNGAGSIVDQLLAVSNDIYIVGHQPGLPVYWKNGTEIVLPHIGTTGFAHAITSYGSDIYICGDESSNTTRIGEYWKNGVATQVTVNNPDSPAFWSIVVR